MKRILFIIILILALFFLYGRYIEVNNLKVNDYVIESDLIPTPFTELKIVQFSDILYDKNKDKVDNLLNRINDLEADIVIFNGDLFNKEIKYNEDDYNYLKEFLSSINATYYKYAVIGDNDKKFLDNYKDMLYDSEFELLDNSNMLFFYKDDKPINIVGLTNYDKDFDSLLESDIEYDYTIVITHKPDTFNKLKNSNINLVLAGHSLGGYVNIPYYGRVIKKDGAKKYYDLYYKEDNKELYVSNGIGYEKYEFRLFNTPSINVFRFKNSNS